MKTGDFTKSFNEIQYRMLSLFESIGGDKALEILDGLATLTRDEREAAVTGCLEAIENAKTANGKLRVISGGAIGSGAVSQRSAWRANFELV